jgi:16S rRNA (guanine527-N7)-methyltransferase
MTEDKDALDPSEDPGQDPEQDPASDVEAAADADSSESPAAPKAPGEPEAPEVPGDEGEIPGDPETPVPSYEELVEALEWGFRGEEIEPVTLQQFARHARLVLETNRNINLTAITDPKEMAVKHYLDSWRVTRMMSLFGRTVLDLGTGAGFPGIPVALAEPDARLTLCDATKKRVDFVQRVIDELKIKNAKAVWSRAEDHMARNSYDVVLARAVSSVRENVRTLRKVRHSVKDYVMLKGGSWSREVRAGEREAERLGFKLETVWEHELPEGMGSRAILIYRAPGAQGA